MQCLGTCVFHSMKLLEWFLSLAIIISLSTRWRNLKLLHSFICWYETGVVCYNYCNNKIINFTVSWNDTHLITTIYTKPYLSKMVASHKFYCKTKLSIAFVMGYWSFKQTCIPILMIVWTAEHIVGLTVIWSNNRGLTLTETLHWFELSLTLVIQWYKILIEVLMIWNNNSGLTII